MTDETDDHLIDEELEERNADEGQRHNDLLRLQKEAPEAFEALGRSDVEPVGEDDLEGGAPFRARRRRRSKFPFHRPRWLP